MSDKLIRQSDAIDVIKKNHYNVGGCGATLKVMIEQIKAIPSADRPQEWIPCSERMPKEDGEYLVSLAFEWGNEIEMGWLLDGEWANPNSHVTIAWQPLPEPWKGVKR